MDEVNFHIDSALRDLEKAVAIIEGEGWTDPEQYEKQWVLKAVKPALFAIKQAIRLLQRVTAIIADDVKEAELQAKYDKWSEDY